MRTCVAFIIFILIVPIGTSVIKGEEDGLPEEIVVPLTNLDIKEPGSYFVENMGQWDEDLSYVAGTDFGHVAVGPKGVYYHIGPSAEGGGPGKENVIRVEFKGGGPLEPIGRKKLDMHMNYLIGNDRSRWASKVPVFESVEVPSIYNGVSARYYFSEEGFKYDLILERGVDPSTIRMRYLGPRDIDVKNNDLFLYLEGGVRLNDGGLYAYSEESGIEISSRFVQPDEDTISFDIGDIPDDGRIIIDPLVYSTYICGGKSEGISKLKRSGQGRIFLAGATESTDFPTTPGAYDTDFSVNGSYQYARDIFIMCLDETGRYPLYSTFLGGEGDDRFNSFALAGDGSAVVAGSTDSNDYPITSGSYNDSSKISRYQSAFITKISPGGSSLVFSTFLWESSYIYGLEIDGSDRILFTGSVYTPFMELKNVSMLNGSGYDAMIGIMSSDGIELIHSSAIGGNRSDNGINILLKDDQLIVAGNTYSGNFPNDTIIQDDAPIYQSMFVVSLDIVNERFDRKILIDDMNDLGPMLLDGKGDDLYIIGAGWGYLESTPDAVDRDSNGNRDVYIMRLNSDWTGIEYLSYLGGPNEERLGGCFFDDMGRLVLGGSTMDGGFPTTDDAWSKDMISRSDLFITLLDLENATMVHSTIIGSSAGEYLNGLCKGEDGRIIAGGQTWAWDGSFPTTEEAFQDGTGLSGTCGYFFHYTLPVLATPPMNLTFRIRYGDGAYIEGTELEWDPPYYWGNMKPRGYQIYRWKEGEEPELLNENIVKNETFYYDPNTRYWEESTFDYFYHVRAVTGFETESPPSEAIDVDDVDGPWIEITGHDGYDVPGTTFDPDIRLHDPSGIDTAWLEYWYNGGDHQIYFIYSEGVPKPHLIIGKFIGWMKFIVHARDKEGNLNETGINTLQLIDNFDPRITDDWTPRTVEAGDNLMFEIAVNENHLMKNVTLEFGYEQEGYSNVSMGSEDGILWTYNYTTRRRPDDIMYRVKGSDHSGNSFETNWKYIKQSGAEAPIFGMNLTPDRVYIGEPIPFGIQIIDHRDVQEVRVLIEGDRYRMIYAGNDTWTFDHVWRGSGNDVHYEFFFVTNWDRTVFGSDDGRVVYFDNVTPNFLEVSNLTGMNLTTGGYFVFWAEAFDDFQVSGVSLFYETDRASYREYMDRVGGPKFSMEIKVPENASTFIYWFQAYDMKGNWVNSSVFSMSVYDSIPPEIRGLDNKYPGTEDNCIEYFDVRENVELDEVWAEYWTSGGDPYYLHVRYDHERSEYYFEPYLEKTKLGPYYYAVYARDVQGNNVESEVYEITQMDTTPPMFGEVEDHIFRADEEFTIVIEMSDNIRVIKVSWEGVPDDLHYADNVNILSGSVERRGIYHIKVTIRDEESNRAETEFILVIESAMEEPEDRTGQIWAGIIIQFILIGALFLVIFIQMNYIHHTRKRLDEMMRSGAGEGHRERFGSYNDPLQRSLEDDYLFEE